MKKRTFQTLIIDDESDARDVLRALMGGFVQTLRSAGKRTLSSEHWRFNRIEAVPRVSGMDLHPGTGFDILDVPNPNFKVVFTTAHDDLPSKPSNTGRCTTC